MGGVGDEGGGKVRGWLWLWEAKGWLWERWCWPQGYLHWGLGCGEIRAPRIWMTIEDKG